MLFIDSAWWFRLAEGLYMQCFGRVAPGHRWASAGASIQDRDSDEKFVSLKHDYNSLQKAPQWKDEPKVLTV